MHEAGADGVGIVLNLTPVLPETEAAADAADGVDAIRNRIWLGPLVDGEYDAGTLRVAPVLEDPDLVRPGDLDLVRGSADWLGVNYYTPARVAEATDECETTDTGGDADVAAFPGVADFRFAPRHPRTDIDWEVDADSLEQLLVDTHQPHRAAAGRHRERRGVRRHDAAARRERRRLRPDRVPALAPGGHRRGPGCRRRRTRLAGVDADGQLRVVPRVHQDVRAGQRGPRHPASYAEALLPLVRRPDPAARDLTVRTWGSATRSRRGGLDAAPRVTC